MAVLATEAPQEESVASRYAMQRLEAKKRSSSIVDTYRSHHVHCCFLDVARRGDRGLVHSSGIPIHRSVVIPTASPPLSSSSSFLTTKQPS